MPIVQENRSTIEYAKYLGTMKTHIRGRSVLLCSEIRENILKEVIPKLKGSVIGGMTEVKKKEQASRDKIGEVKS